MKVTQERLPNSQMGLEIEVEAVRSKDAYEGVVRKYLKTARIPGFRPGKAPRPLVIQYLGKQALKAEALEKLLDDTFKEALEQNVPDALGNYQILTKFEDILAVYEPGQPLVYKAAVDVQPEVSLNSYTGLTIQYTVKEYDPAMVEEQLNAARDRKATVTPVLGRPAQLGDVAILDFVGRTPEGLEIDGAKATGFQMDLLEDRFIPGFIAGIVGMEVEETREIPAQFPQDYAREELSNQAAIFTVTLHELKEKLLPELTDSFAQEVGEVTTLEELRLQMETEGKQKIDQENQDARDTAVLDALISRTYVDLPRTLVEQEFRFLADQYVQRLSQIQGVDVNRFFSEENMPFIRENLTQEAVTRLKRTLALAEVAKREGLTVEDDEVTPRLVEYIQSMGQQEIDRESLITLVRDELLTEKILDWLVTHSTLEVVSAAAVPVALPEGLEVEVVSEATEPPADEVQIEEEATTPLDKEE